MMVLTRPLASAISALARHHVRRPLLNISLFVLVILLATIWVAIIPTKVYTDFRTLMSRGTDIAGRDQAVQSLRKDRRHFDAWENQVSFLIETPDTSENIFDTPYSELLCEIRGIYEEISSWGDVCAKQDTNSVPVIVSRSVDHKGNSTRHRTSVCRQPLSVVDLPRMFRESIPENTKKLIRDVSSSFSAEIMATHVKNSCVASTLHVPPCSLRSVIGCDDAEHCNAPCIIAGSDICQILEALDPTAAELESLAESNYAHDLDVKGCGEEYFDFESFHRSLTTFNTIVGFEERSAGNTHIQNILPTTGLSKFVSHEAVLLSKEGETAGEAVRSNITRIVLQLNSSASSKAKDAFVKEAGARVIEYAKSSGLRASWGNANTLEAVVNEALFRDAKLSVFSVLFVSLFIFWHTKSFVLTSGALISALGSMPLSALLYRVVLDIHWAGVFSFIALFLTIGIAVDDIFVTLDYWKGAPRNVHESIERRLQWTLEKAFVSMGVTSMTTAAAFSANFLSPISSVRLFGAIMAILVIMNYIIVLLVFPSFLVLSERKALRKESSALPTMQNTTHSEDMTTNSTHCCHDNETLNQSNNDLASSNASSESESKQDKNTSDDDCFDENIDTTTSTSTSTSTSSPSIHKCAKKIFTFDTEVLTGSIVKYAEGLCLSALAMMVVFGVIAKNMQGPNSLLNIFPDNHNFQQYNAMEKRLGTASGMMSTLPTLVWGVIPNDIIDRHDPLSNVPLELDESFHMKDEESQKWFLDLCMDLSSPRRSEAARIVQGSLSCLHLDLHHWLQAENRASKIAGSNLTTSKAGLPVPEDQWNATVSAFLKSSDASHFMTRESGIWFGNSSSAELSRKVSGREAVFAISFDLKLSFHEGLKLQDEWRYWEKWLQHRLKSAPAAVSNGFLGSRNFHWSIMEAMSILTPTAITSVLASLGLAFCVLLAGTKALSLAFAALMCLIGVLLAFLAFMVVSGWRLNMIESCCVALVCGLSVDYVAHVAVGYANAPNIIHSLGGEKGDETDITSESIREGEHIVEGSGHAGNTSEATQEESHPKKCIYMYTLKLMPRKEAAQGCQYALHMIGSSIFNGMLTTVGASAFLWWCEIIVLARFGIFVAFTLVTAFVMATVVFPAIVISARLPWRISKAKRC